MPAAPHQIDCKPLAPKFEEKEEEEDSHRKKKEDIDEDALFESLKDIVRKDYLNKQESH